MLSKRLSTKFFTLCVLFSMVTLLANPLGAHSSDKCQNKSKSQNWRSFGRNHKNWRNAVEETVLNRKNVQNLKLKWQFTSGEVTNVAAVDGVLYYTDLVGNAYAVDADNGNQIWTTSLVPGDDFFLTPAVGKTTLYVVGGLTGLLFALDKKTGAILPPYPIQVNANPASGLSNVYSAPVLVEKEDLLFITTANNFTSPVSQFGSVRAFRASTGEQLWAYQTSLNPVPNQPNSGGNGVGIFGTPAIDTKNGLLLVGTGQNYNLPVTPIADAIIALDYRNGGNLVWYHQFVNDDVGTWPSGDCFYSGFPLKDWDADGGPILLTIKDKCKKKKGKCQKQDIAIIGTKEGNCSALDRLNGTLLWTTILTNPNPTGSSNGGVNSFGCTDGEVVYFPSVYSTNGIPITSDLQTTGVATGIFAVRAKDGHILWRKDFNGITTGPLSFANGVVYYVNSTNVFPETINPDNPTGEPFIVVAQPSPAAGTYPSNGSNFGPQVFPNITATVISTPNLDGTPAPGQNFNGKIVLVKRGGGISFVTKVKNAQNAGAVAVILVNNVPGIITPGGTDPTITIPSMLVSLSDGTTIINGVAEDPSTQATIHSPSNFGYTLFALDAKNGDVLLNMENLGDLGVYSEGGPTIYRGKVYIGFKNGVRAFDLSHQ